MPPAKAVEILKAMDDQTVIDLFHSVEEQAKAAGTSSLVSVWLAGMPADRSATLQRKMADKPTSLE
jgi:hypothetical protein